MFEHDTFITALREWMEESMHRSMHAFFRYSRTSTLSLSQTNCLFRLYHHGPRPVNDLADYLGITMAAVSQLLAPLEDSNLIERLQDPDDRRVKHIALTSEGQARVKEIMLARHAWLEDLALSLTTEEKQNMLSTVKSLTEKSRSIRHNSDQYR